ncbi:MAG: hypothetical protein ACP5VS_09105 [Desulfomonilaceae bacterium]
MMQLQGGRSAITFNNIILRAGIVKQPVAGAYHFDLRIEISGCCGVLALKKTMALQFASAP